MPRPKVLIATSRPMEARLISMMLSILDVDHAVAGSVAELQTQCAGRSWGAILAELDVADMDILRLAESDDGCLRDQALVGMTSNPDLCHGGFKLGGRPVQVLYWPFGFRELSKVLLVLDIPTKAVDDEAVRSWAERQRRD